MCRFREILAQNAEKKSRDLMCFFLKMTISKAILETNAKEMGIKTTPRSIICLWKKKGMISKVSKNQWIKLKKFNLFKV